MEFRSVPGSYVKNYLPSKKILVLGGVVFLGVGLYFLIPYAIEYYQTHRAEFSITGTPPAPLFAAVGTESPLDRDTDKDGIPDWQEALFGFDPNKADTNGDGTPDTLPAANGISIGDALNLSDLNKLTLAVYGKFQNTPTDDINPDQVAAATSSEVLAHAQSIENGFKRYSAIDLNLSESENSDILAYGSSISALVDTVGDPIAFVKDVQQKILDNEDPKAQIALLNPIVTRLLAMPVPAKISDIHLALVNGASYIVQALQLPADGEELTTFTKSLIAQKNINILQQSLADIVALTAVYSQN